MNDDFHAAWADNASTLSAHAVTAETATDSGQPKAAGKAALKQIVTIRLDVDTLAWFKDAGPGYQTRINQILRDYMDAQIADERSASAVN